jgi:hypothetical protein
MQNFINFTSEFYFYVAHHKKSVLELHQPTLLQIQSFIDCSTSSPAKKKEEEKLCLDFNECAILCGYNHKSKQYHAMTVDCDFFAGFHLST